MRFSASLPSTIESVRHNGLASLCGIVRGDQILSVNGYDVTATSPQLIQHLLTESEGPLELMVRRKIVGSDFNNINKIIKNVKRKYHKNGNDSSLQL